MVITSIDLHAEGVVALRHGTDHDIAVGDDADGLLRLRVDDGNRAAVALDHRRGDLPKVGIRRTGGYLLCHDVSHLHECSLSS